MTSGAFVFGCGLLAMGGLLSASILAAAIERTTFLGQPVVGPPEQQEETP